MICKIDVKRPELLSHPRLGIMGVHPQVRDYFAFLDYEIEARGWPPLIFTEFARYPVTPDAAFSWHFLSRWDDDPVAQWYCRAGDARTRDPKTGIILYTPKQMATIKDITRINFPKVELDDRPHGTAPHLHAEWPDSRGKPREWLHGPPRGIV